MIVTGGNHFDLLVRFARLPNPNDRLTSREVVLAPGGMGGNVAVAFARLGGCVRFAGLIADNEDGRALRDDLECEGVDVRFAFTHPSPGLQRGLILVGQQGERAILGGVPDRTDLPRSSSKSLARVDAVPSAGWRALLTRRLLDQPLDAELFQPPISGIYCPSAVAAALLPQLPADLPLFVDIETGHLDALEQNEVVVLLRRAALVFGNESNLSALASRLGLRDLAELQTCLDSPLISTMGARGCAVYTSNGGEVTPAFPVNAVDTTGAGDCFAAAFVMATLRGGTLSFAARYACAAGALSTGCLGARTGSPTAGEVAQLLEQS